MLIGVAAVLLTFLTAGALGFRSQGPIWVAIAVGAVTSLSIVGVGLLVAYFSRTVSEALIIANFPLMLLMFFSGSIFPIRQVPLLGIGERTIGLFDILPPTHAVVALNKVLTLGAGLGGMWPLNRNVSFCMATRGVTVQKLTFWANEGLI